MFNDAVILITGGTGSFGKRLVSTILQNYKPRKLIIFSRDELKQYEMMQQIPQAKAESVRFFIGDVRDQERLYEAFHGVDYVIHAAALKQVPAAEYNPFEAIKTNVLGAQNVIRASVEQKVKKVIALSTDKAANPVNLYGATKLCSDKLFIAGNAMASHSQTRFAVVRYGNVVGSRGSVFPLFMKKRNDGVIPITDERMSRFSITLQEGVDLVVKAFSTMQGGEIFVPKIPSYRITDVAKAIAPNAKIQIVGIRPGEKLHEMMIPEDEARNTLEFDEYFVIQPTFDWWGEFKDKAALGKGKVCAEGFSYTSNNNNNWLSIQEIRRLAETCLQEESFE